MDVAAELVYRGGYRVLFGFDGLARNEKGERVPVPATEPSEILEVRIRHAPHFLNGTRIFGGPVVRVEEPCNVDGKVLVNVGPKSYESPRYLMPPARRGVFAVSIRRGMASRGDAAVFDPLNLLLDATTSFRLIEKRITPHALTTTLSWTRSTVTVRMLAHSDLGTTYLNPLLLSCVVLDYVEELSEKFPVTGRQTPLVGPPGTPLEKLDREALDDVVGIVIDVAGSDVEVLTLPSDPDEKFERYNVVAVYARVGPDQDARYYTISLGVSPIGTALTVSGGAAVLSRYDEVVDMKTEVYAWSSGGYTAIGFAARPAVLGVGMDAKQAYRLVTRISELMDAISNTPRN